MATNTNSPGSSQQQQFKPVFNQEEIRTLKECNQEAFYYRCVPFAAAFVAAAYAGMRKGYLKKSEAFGYTPKCMAASLAGYLLGKVSYQNACAEKLMRLPNSPLGESLRKNKGRLGFQESVNVEPGFSIAGAPNELEPLHPRQPMFEDHRPDTHNEGLDDYERGVTDSLTPYTDIGEGLPQGNSSYTDLRRQNREEYLHRMAEKYKRSVPDSPSDSGLSNLPYDNAHGPPPPPISKPSSPPRHVKKNQYGDEIYE